MYQHYKFLLIATFALLIPGCFTSNPDTATRYSVVNEQGCVSQPVLQLLQLSNIEHDGTLYDIVAKTQMTWLRKAGAERWDIEPTQLPHASQINDLLTKIGMYNEVEPAHRQYDYLLFLGAIFNTMVHRMEYAVHLWDQGVRFNHIVLLAGQRPAVPSQGENSANFLAFSKQSSLESEPATETEMLKFVYDHIAMPEEMRQLPITIIDVPMQAKTDGSLRRPNTADTIEYWMETNPKSGNCLAISNQPFVNYQHAVLKTLLPAEFKLEVVGNKSTDHTIGLALDSLARILYQEQEYLKKTTHHINR